MPELLTVTNAVYNEYEFVRAEPGVVKLAPLRRHFYLGANARDVARLEDPELRARMRACSREHGWSTWTRARYVLGLSAVGRRATTAAARGRWSRDCARRLRRPPSSPIRRARSAYALERPGAPERRRAIICGRCMSRPGGARELAGYPAGGLR